ncbi:AraC family transcriptional regulator [Paenibacillus sp. LjRoot56]
MHNIHSIHYIVRGTGYYVMNKVKYGLEAGSVMLFVPETTFEWWLSLIHQIYDQQYSSDADSAIGFTCQYIADHYQSPLTVEQLAKMAGLSEGYYSRQFKRLTGLSPKDYIIRLRVTKAKDLLACSGLTMTYISELVGYDDEFYFSRVFKRITGMTPSSYAKLSRKL